MNDPSYYNDNKLIRHYRVGVACGPCHIAPNPNNPPLARNDFHAGHRKFHNHFVWQGKVFDPGKGVLRNKILPFGLNAIIARVYKGSSWMDKKIASSSTIPRRSLLVHWVRDEIRDVAPLTYLGKVYRAKKAWLISPWSLQLPRNQIVRSSEVP